MANTYKNAAVVMTSTGATDLYTVPSGMRAIVQSVNVANVDGSDRYVTVTWYDSSAAASYTLLYNGFIPGGTALNALDVPLVLETGDIVRVQASAANTLHATASILQIDPSSQYPDGSITVEKLADGSIPSTKLADGSITSAKILDGTIATSDIANSAITSAKILDGTIVGDDIAASTIGYEKINTNQTNWAQNTLSGVSVNTTTPTAIASVTFTSRGRGPVLALAHGDANPGVAGNWHYISFYLDGNAVNPFIINQTSGASYNNPFALTRMLGVLSAGSHTIQVRAWQGVGEITYGETGSNQAPSLVVVELF